MEALDSAYKRFEELQEEIKVYQSTIISEQDTRLKIVNRILTEILGWNYIDIKTEEGAGSGFLDYKLSINGYAKLIIEAKRDENELGVSTKPGGRGFKLDGPAFQNPIIKKGIEQAVNYCGQKNAELASVTNGKEWVIFRGSRIGDGRDTMEGVAFIFASLEEVNHRFNMFYDLLSYDSVKEYKFRAYFQDAEGQPVRVHDFRKTLRTVDSKKIISRGPLSHDLDRVMTVFFTRLTGDYDPDMLAKCFVVTKESNIADMKLVHISEDLVSLVKEIDTDNSHFLTEIIERVKTTQRNEFVILVGTKGAGKTTFVDRFFRFVLPKELSKSCIVIRINLADSPGDDKKVTDWLTEKLLEKTENELFADRCPSYEEIQGMFYDEYTRWREGSNKFLYEKDKQQFKIDFGKHIEERREKRPHEYLTRLLSSVVKSRRKVPCIIFDNADHFSIQFQERVFQFARSIYESTLCLIIVPITDKTSWQLSQQGALQSFENEALYLPTPSPKKNIGKEN